MFNLNFKMNLIKIQSKFNITTVLIAPLDWGLGHATRCIPLIKALLLNNCKVIIACNKQQKKLLEQEFTNVAFLFLEGYNITYASNPKLLPLSILKQLPQINKAINRENLWLNKIIDKHDIKLVISDNRYGLYSNKVPCVFVTHQLTIKAPFSFVEKYLQLINYQFINRFTACWVPDFASDNNVAGILSHPKKMPNIPVSYIGLLSRFKTTKTIDKKYDFCVVLSGPEPQRTVLEQLILKDIHLINSTILLVRGKPLSEENLPTFLNVEIVNHLVGSDLQLAFQQSNYIISRSGYSTVLELLSLQKKSILIPTPGQTEQEYLGKKLMTQGWCYTISQKEFSLQKAISEAEKFKYQLPQLETVSLQDFIAQFLEKQFK